MVISDVRDTKFYQLLPESKNTDTVWELEFKQ